MSDSKTARVIVEHPRPSIAVIRMNRPEKYNAIDAGLLAELLEATVAINDDHQIRAVVLSGTAKAFAAGADITEYVGQSPEQLRAFTTQANRVADAIHGLRVPVIAAVTGVALGGGCEIALACDLIHMGESAQLGLPELSLGLIPGWGGTQRLPALIGRAQAFRIIAFGERITAAHALEMGIASRVDPDDLVVDKAIETAERIAGLPELAVAALRRSLRSATPMPAEGFAHEQRELLDLFDSADGREGVAAFVEKRPARFA